MAQGPRAQLFTYLVVSRDSRPDQVVVWDTARIRIGRHHEQDLVLDDPEASRQHAVLRRDGDRCSIEDLGTANGTFVNDEPVQNVALRPDDAIRIGQFCLRFCQSTEDPAATRPNVILSSRLHGYQPLCDDSNGSTMLGLPADDAALWTAGTRSSVHPTSQHSVRDLDEELGLPEKDELVVFGSPDDPDPLMASAFDLGQPLPPVGLARGRSPGTPHAAAGEQSAPTVPAGVHAGAEAGGTSIDITLQLDGVPPELLRTLQTLLGQRFDLRNLAVVLKALAIR